MQPGRGGTPLREALGVVPRVSASIRLLSRFKPHTNAKRWGLGGKVVSSHRCRQRPGVPVIERIGKAIPFPGAAGCAGLLQGMRITAALAGVAAVAAAFPARSVALEEAPAGFIQALLELIEALGPLGPAAYTALVCLCELIPLFPTQPLSLASGLLFGPQMGTLCVCVGTTLAAAAAFAISQGVGKTLVEKIIERELEEINGSSKGKNLLMSRFRHIEETIEHGSFLKQAGAICALRLTLVVPFSASNYLLGLTPVGRWPYLAGTVVGMGCWSLVYASLGGASRSLLASGVSADALLTDLVERASEYTQQVAAVGLLVGIVVAGVCGAGYACKTLSPPSKPHTSADVFRGPLPPETHKDKLVEQLKD